ncbi:MAG: DEAD/DEAH box helicase [Proteobacteria bacterium]|nr:DEAD/DEAH box helicase [Pseudomonadota bacterium]
MIRSTQFELGRDKTRMKNPKDAERQHATVDALLDRLFTEDPLRRKEIQIVADEVGMGKTFVALGAAYSLLASMKDKEQSHPDLVDCYTKVLIITPANGGLFSKWMREVGEFVKRCVKPEHAPAAQTWFAADPIKNWDELPAKLRRPGAGRAILVGQMSLFSGGKLRNYDLKCRYMLGLVFTHWGTRFKNDERERLLKGAPGWPQSSGDLTNLTDEDRTLIPLGDVELNAGIDDYDLRGDLEDLLQACRDIAQPYTRDRNELFEKVRKGVMEVYAHATWYAIRRAIPLVIIDEAHHWKNGPSTGSFGFERFADNIASKTRRAVLLTATPFQLRPQEMLELFRIGDRLSTSPTEADASERRAALVRHRTEVLEPVLRNSKLASQEFATGWHRIPRRIASTDLGSAWSTPSIAAARALLRDHAAEPGVVNDLRVRSIIANAVMHLDPSLREAIRLALRLYVANTDLSSELATVVIRHRRHTQHRAFLVGAEYEAGIAASMGRQDRNVLHGAPGMDVQGPGELPHYLLMRAVSEMKQGKGRSSLGTALTGCYSTLLHSSEGKKVTTALTAESLGGVYLNALRAAVGPENDPDHPKVRRVVDAVLAAWARGEKTLVFCFRVNTAKRLQEIIDKRMRADLDARQEKCLGGPAALKALKGRITRRDGDLVGLALDRVLWSFYWARDRLSEDLIDDELALTDADLAVVAEVALRHEIDILAERPDRVFIHRAVEHALAVRLQHNPEVARLLEDVLPDIANRSWVSHPYGLIPNDEPDDGEDEADPSIDERGVHAIYPEVVKRPTPQDIQALTKKLLERRARLESQDRTAIFDGYERAPSLWFGQDPTQLDGHAHQFVVRPLHQHLRTLTIGDELDWNSRRLAFQALRRIVLRDSVLLRLLPDRGDRVEGGWGTMLAEQFYEPLPGQSESLAARAAVFVEDLASASGRIGDENDARNDLFEATKLRDDSFVALASGDTEPTRRNRVFAGFNTPLLPEVLICTSVGQEGIDLHRHCRHVVHYDLAWNPAVLEQRTGRTYRIGSMTFRERKEVSSGGPYLEVGVPFLAGTYDERMYEELRLRAQTFEVLTGGDLSTDSNPDGHDDVDDAEGASADTPMVALPEAMLAELRVRLHVWEAAT